MLSRVAHERGWEALQPCDISLGDDGLDLSTRIGQRALEEQIRLYRPDFVCWAPPCSDYSPLQNILPRDPTKRAQRLTRLIKSRKLSSQLWQFCVRIIRRDVRGNETPSRIHLVENPWTSKAWDLFQVPGFRARVDQCRFGLKVHHSSRLRVMKPTRLQCTDQTVSQLLEATCCCDPKVPDHIISGDKIGGRWLARAKRFGSWPRAFCVHILSAVEQVLGQVHEAHLLDAYQEDALDSQDEVHEQESDTPVRSAAPGRREAGDCRGRQDHSVRNLRSC